MKRKTVNCEMVMNIATYLFGFQDIIFKPNAEMNEKKLSVIFGREIGLDLEQLYQSSLPFYGLFWGLKNRDSIRIGTFVVFPVHFWTSSSDRHLFSLHSCHF